MRKLVLNFVLILIVLLFACKKAYLDKPSPKPQVDPASMILKGFTAGIGANIGGYYAGIPGAYDHETNSYPLLLYMHGGGQFGNGDVDLPNLLSEGIPALLDTKKFPPAINSNGQVYSFLVLVPQFRSYPSNTDIQTFLEYARKNYRIDAARLYVTGFSIGGKITCDFASENASIISAIVPIAGASSDALEEKCKNIVESKLPVWAFHNEQDELISVNETKNFISALKNFSPLIQPRLTLFANSSALLKHDAWTRATDPEYRENGMNMYEWMLQYKR
jgi:predicted peptidase